MKLQQEDQGRSKEASGPWADWLKGQEHKQCSPLSFQLMRKKQEEPADQHPAPSLLSLAEFQVF